MLVGVDILVGVDAINTYASQDDNQSHSDRNKSNYWIAHFITPPPSAGGARF